MKPNLDKVMAFGLYAFALFLPFSITGAQSCMALLLAAWIVHGLIHRSIGYRLAPWEPFMIAFLAWVVLAAFFSVHPEITLPKLRRLWIFAGYFAVSRACIDGRRAINALKIMVLSAGVVAVYGICQHFFGNAVPRFFAPEVDLWQKTGGYFHAVGLFDHHLTYGNSLILVLFAAIGLVACQGFHRAALPFAAAGALELLALVYTYARSAWMGFVAGVFAFSFQLGKRTIVPAFIGLGLLMALGVGLSSSMRDRLQTALSAENNLERIATWTTTAQMIRDHPVFGIGAGSYRILAPEYRLGYNIHWTAKSHAHNTFLQVGAESGLFALAAFVGWLCALFAWATSRSKQIADKPTRRLLYALIAGHAAFAVSSLFQHNLGDAEVASTWFLLLAATNALVRGASDAKSQDCEQGL